MTRFILVAVGVIVLCVAALPAQAQVPAPVQNDCSAPTVSVQSAKKFVDTKADANAAPSASKPADDIVQLGDIIELTVMGLPELFGRH
jgi:hypothetical protein